MAAFFLLFLSLSLSFPPPSFRDDYSHGAQFEVKILPENEIRKKIDALPLSLNLSMESP